MIKPLIIAISAMVFSSAALAAAHTAAPKDATTAGKPTASEAKKDAKGETQANKENKMSPTGQNETSSTTAGKPTASEAKKDATTAGKPTASEAKKDAKGETQANKENKMSPTGQNETASTGTQKKKADDMGSSTKAK